ncbi:accessory Sec system S-layer assembly protein [Brevibacillus sp. SYP-B805]|uniref:accessory Sec system S-layer assembly protein n=1 Tax=Brevibacillus sp. SYP-B805 TaxID=1578199 RepID=UPI0013EA6590|nr:accessory Sec system S-layer assembly protein [Brevibacillus sp. SYP-B805]NGQ95612.1 accessory Sec system S-layer assembly protein [Brevibacillus sp. SYP-B805]
MLSFLKSLLGKQPNPEEIKEQIKEESVLPAAEAPLGDGGKDAPANDPAQRVTPLSLHESWEQRLSQQEKYTLSFMANELPPMAEGSVSLAGIGLVPHEEGILVTAFIRNGLPRPIRLQKMPLVVLVKQGELFARQVFDLSEAGEIPPFHARPWEFVFTREHFLQVNLLLTNWKLAFEIAEKKMILPQQLELEESWIKTLTDEQKHQLIELAKRLPPIQHGEVNVQSVQLHKDDAGSLRALLLIRNGSDKALSFEKLPLALVDATGETAAQGLFELGGLTVNPGTSKPWLFIYPPESIVKQDADFSRWSVRVPQA